MKVLYDYQIFMQEFGGISRYFCEIMNQFQRDADIDFEAALIFSNNHYLKKKKIFKYKNFFKNFNFRGKIRLMNFFNKFESSRRIKRLDFDIFHPTYYSPYFLKYLKNKPFVLTVHDMIHEKFPYYFPRQDKTSEYKRLLCERAAKIIAISHNTKKDLMEIFGIKENKIKVIYHGCPFENLDVSKIDKINDNKIIKGEKNVCLSENYILFVGRRSNYKNFNFFVRAIAPILLKEFFLKVICGGGEPFTREEFFLFDELKVRDRFIHIPVESDDLLIKLYKNALCFVFPSLYEGFGLGILEAFKCGCPVLVTNSSSFLEVAGDAAIYFDARDEGSLMEAVLKILNNNDLRKQLIKKGEERVKQFSWEKTAKETKKVYMEIA